MRATCVVCQVHLGEALVRHGELRLVVHYARLERPCGVLHYTNALGHKGHVEGLGSGDRDLRVNSIRPNGVRLLRAGMLLSLEQMLLRAMASCHLA